MGDHERKYQYESELIRNLTEGPHPDAEEATELMSKCDFIDLRYCEAARMEIWRTGRLPRWIRNFKSLRILQASSLGLIAISDWIVELEELQELYIENNIIRTWPHHLEKLKKLQIVRADGNPFLELAFKKSPTLQWMFSRWNNDEMIEPTKVLPEELRGPEWTYVKHTRLTAPHKLHGFYCGGIYSLVTPPSPTVHGLVTSLELCPVQRRIMYSQSPNDPFSSHCLSETSGGAWDRADDSWKAFRQNKTGVVDECEPKNHTDEYTRALKDALRDVAALIDCSSSDIQIKSLGPRKRDKMQNGNNINWHQISKLVRQLIYSEQSYINSLREAMVVYCKESLGQKIEKYFHHSGSARTISHLVSADNFLTVSNRILLQELFREFPVLWLFHSKWFIVEIAQLYRACSRPRHGDEFDTQIGEALMKLYSTLLNEGELYRSYAGKIAHAEAIFIYDEAYDNNLTRRLAQTDREKRLMQLNQWINRRISKFGHGGRLHLDYLTLPFKRLLVYHSFFQSASRRYKCFESIATILKDIRNDMSKSLRESRQKVRAASLARSLRTLQDNFDGYCWDAVLLVTSRAYLEEGKLEIGNNDVIDPVDDAAKSFVKEVFTLNQRSLRLVATTSTIQLWDEKFCQYLGAFTCNDLEISKESESLIRINFKNVRETCVAIVDRFVIADENLEASQDHCHRFITAFNGHRTSYPKH